jgi:hypothetical protein
MVQRLARLSIILIPLVFYSSLDWAASWQQGGAIRVSTEYETNPTMVLANPSGIWQSVFAPSYTLKRAGDANELNAGAALQIARSSNKALSQDRNDPSAFLGWNRHSEAGNFGISARYDETSTRISEISNTGPILADSTRASRIMSGSWNKALSERSTLSVDGAYEGVSYSSGSSGAYTGYATRSGNMMFQYDWSERSKPYVRISYTDYEPANGDLILPSHSANVALGLNWEATEYLKGTLQVGKSKVSSSAGMGTQGLVSVQYTGQRTGLVLNASRQVSATGLGGFVTVDQANGNWSYALNELNRFGIDLGRQKNHYVDETIYSTTGAWLQHDINFFWGARTYYLHRKSYQVGIGGASSDTLGVVLTYTNADF